MFENGEVTDIPMTRTILGARPRLPCDKTRSTEEILEVLEVVQWKGVGRVGSESAQEVFTVPTV